MSQAGGVAGCVNSYTWDRANRLLSTGGSAYAYDGAGNRISQTVGVDVTQYLLDLQPGLATVLQATQDTDTTRYLHAPRGIHSQQDASDQWTWMLQDGLGSVRSVVDDSLSVLESRLYELYGVPFGTSGTSQTVYGFTGEPLDGNELVYLRARYYAPNMGIFTGLDPFEGMAQRPMSLNRYSYVQGNPIIHVDPTGMQASSDYPSCPFGGWDCEAIQNVYNLRNAFLSSASVIVGEGKIGNVLPENRDRDMKENLAASSGCVVSGLFVGEALKQGDWRTFFNYLTNQVIPEVNWFPKYPSLNETFRYASVGIGNMKLPTAANLWLRQSCNLFGECVPVQVNPLVGTTPLGFEVNLLNPFTGYVCSGGNCAAGEPTTVEAYQKIEAQLLQNDLNIEYVAAHLESGALRARTIGLNPTAFNSVTWYIRSVQTREELNRMFQLVSPNGQAFPDPTGHAGFVLNNISTALHAMKITSNWVYKPSIETWQ